ncbi:hypothetical protein BEP19_16410 [Ammoniphilus oxalaticus]|uniref:Uncharacterized protein n=1 Tax=Ammoniphilus oxalaticus TaxID=66863 RepID=A0A419SQL3_9BACL|nr:hypothetical protein [Ammoniphilus oxalaticus]RKD26780.1 hypothetical protein BEP19_16410 [Ammoniphilus oxalaticus]
MSNGKIDIDNMINHSGNANVFVYVDTTSIAFAMLCCFGSFAATNASLTGQNETYETMMKGILKTFDDFLEKDKIRREEFINEVKEAMQPNNEEK